MPRELAALSLSLSFLDMLGVSYERPNHHQLPVHLVPNQKNRWERFPTRAAHQVRVRLESVSEAQPDRVRDLGPLTRTEEGHPCIHSEQRNLRIAVTLQKMVIETFAVPKSS